VIFLLVVLLVPRGIIPTGGEWIRRLTTRGRSALPPAVPAAEAAQETRDEVRDPARSGPHGGAG